MNSQDCIISVANLNKNYSDGLKALSNINLDIKKGEIFALLGPNGAGKTTLIGSICGIVNPTDGKITVGGFDIISDYRKSRSLIGLVPQELTTEAFESVWNTVNYSRGLFGKKKNHTYIEDILKKLSLWEKKDNRIMTLSGGMKRRVMIAKALSHEPEVLFLDEPSAGVDVELRKGMWKLVHELRESGVTIILTTHYIDEAEEMADRIGIIQKGKITLIEDKKALIKKLGSKKLELELSETLEKVPSELSSYNLLLSDDKQKLTFHYDSNKNENSLSVLLDKLKEHNISYKDLSTKQSSLEEIFIQLMN